ncbi:hypothetical protein QP893_04175 [Corynebacterium pseudodiphtheriticum]|uniref:hypothetical protein n=1 Tax=Corynebacterium TaxID=1716 RepID=UPI002540F6D2|nr:MULTISPECIES: hypothetical protein [Corynebacterium]MDK4252950.1 hypothetical protein [Corynebacterium propinquum]MDK4338827.1 hypothetical protein [Corynebacterium pseudodiphtheriticum]MDK8737909.1 hypothetical protein [Corynebacterium pseudodiphtheriticum]
MFQIFPSTQTEQNLGHFDGWMSANDIPALENLDKIPPEEGGDLYLANGNMLPLGMAGAYASTTTDPPAV